MRKVTWAAWVATAARHGNDFWADNFCEAMSMEL